MPNMKPTKNEASERAVTESVRAVRAPVRDIRNPVRAVGDHVRDSIYKTNETRGIRKGRNGIRKSRR